MPKKAPKIYAIKIILRLFEINSVWFEEISLKYPKNLIKPIKVNANQNEYINFRVRNELNNIHIKNKSTSQNFLKIKTLLFLLIKEVYIMEEAKAKDIGSRKYTKLLKSELTLTPSILYLK